jgi:hypothetical protein
MAANTKTINKAYHSHSQQLLGRLSNQLRAGWRHDVNKGIFFNN